MTRLTDKQFFCSSSVNVGYKAYQFTDYYTVLKEYVGMQQKLDSVYGDLGIVDIVDKEMANRFKQAIYKLRISMEMEAHGRAESDEVIKRIEICKRGLSAMKKYAEDNNLVPDIDIWIYEEHGKKLFAIIKDKDKLDMAKSLYSDVEAIYNLTEIYLMIKNYDSTHQVKKQLSNAGHTPIIKDIKEETKEEFYDDEVPF